MIAMFVGLAALFGTVTYLMHRDRGWTWMSVSLAVITVVFGLGSILESLLLRIELTDEALVATDLRGTKRYAIADIERVEEAKGCPTAILLKDGRWVKLPSVGSNLGNSIRAWLKQSRSSVES